MHSVWLIAKREYLERVRSRAFRISTILVPVAFAALFGIAAFSGRFSMGPQQIVVASNDPDLAAAAEAELKAAWKQSATDSASTGMGGAPVKIEQKTMDRDGDLAGLNLAGLNLAGLNNDIETKRIDAYLWLKRGNDGGQVQALYASRNSADLIVRSWIRDAVGRAVVTEELEKRGVPKQNAEGLLKNVDLTTSLVKNGQLVSSDADKGFWGAYVMAFMLYAAVVFYGVNVAQSVVSEKSSRVFEVLLALTEPDSLMAGKLLGVTAVALTQICIWIGLLLLFGSTSLIVELGRGGLEAYGLTPLHLVFFVIYFILGFVFYCSIALGFGATLNQASEMQQVGIVIGMPQLIGLVLIIYILGQPSALPVVLLSLFPPCTPIVMCLRMGAIAVPWWQLALSVVLMVASIYGVVRVVSRVYRTSILMYGKRVTLPELARWFRYSS
jgi:ABC-2 type transport system permease protein